MMTGEEFFVVCLITVVLGFGSFLGGAWLTQSDFYLKDGDAATIHLEGIYSLETCRIERDKLNKAYNANFICLETD